MCTSDNRDSQLILVVVSFVRAVGELSRKGRRLGHATLDDSRNGLKLRLFTLRSMGKFLPALYIVKTKRYIRQRIQASVVRETDRIRRHAVPVAE